MFGPNIIVTGAPFHFKMWGGHIDLYSGHQQSNRYVGTKKVAHDNFQKKKIDICTHNTIHRHVRATNEISAFDLFENRPIFEMTYQLG